MVNLARPASTVACAQNDPAGVGGGGERLVPVENTDEEAKVNEKWWEVGMGETSQLGRKSGERGGSQRGEDLGGGLAGAQVRRDIQRTVGLERVLQFRGAEGVQGLWGRKSNLRDKC